MRDPNIVICSLLEDSWLPLEQVAAACRVDAEWLERHIDEGLLPGAKSVAGIWRFSGNTLRRVRLMRQLERDFDAVPELAALVADMMEELDALRATKPYHGR
ncbi:chaperone modulator CbpM [Paludibacterium paludis]|uniref:MerR family transcriptional regulator n=1 Tax=Paludibacterium paludis TaxID=1225769 RepID=A0A918UB47_9NEIS|nr:chaperone modulator CbpM [Paludibacterium paludis]GGY19987.1 hypothetical protein GCM10011289_24340 [Paludibacterium paludis]